MADTNQQKAQLDRTLKEIKAGAESIHADRDHVNFKVRDPGIAAGHPDPRISTDIQDLVTDDKSLRKVLLDPPAAGGAAPLNEFKTLANYANGGRNTPPAAPPADPVSNAQLIPYQNRVDGLAAEAGVHLRNIERKAAETINKLIYDAKEVTADEWQNIYKHSLAVFEKSINDEIKEIDDLTFARFIAPAPPAMPPVPPIADTAENKREFESNKIMQKESLNNLKNTFKSKVEQHFLTTLPKAIQEAKFKDQRPAPPIPAGAAGLVPDNRFNAGGEYNLKEHDKRKRFQELAEDADLTRARLNQYSKFNPKKIIRDTIPWTSKDEAIEQFTPGKYQTARAANWKPWRRKDFEITEDGVKFNAGSWYNLNREADIQNIMRAYTAAHGGKKTGVLHTGKNVSLSDLQMIAKALKNMGPPPLPAANPDYTLTLGKDTVENLRKQKVNDADILALGRDISNDPNWQLPVAEAANRAGPR